VACGSFRIEIVGSETPLQSRLEEDVFAEVAATNMAIVKAMGLLASVATDRRPHLSRILEAGLLDFEQIDYPNIPKRRRAGFRRKVKARTLVFCEQFREKRSFGVVRFNGNRNRSILHT